MKRVPWSACVLALACVFPVTLGARAQHAHPDHGAAPLDTAALDFIRLARASTEQYHTLDAAIAAGYRRIGPDMPNMGEHWVHPRLALQGGLDPTRPAVLTYLRVQGTPVLTGVAYTAPVLDGEVPPDVPFSGASWHTHSGSVEEELIGGGTHEEDTGIRLAMMHAWIWTDNPDGVFTADNWALPYVRLGLPVPEKAPPDAARALFLLDGGVEYYMDLIETAGPPDATERGAIRDILADYRSRIKRTAQQDTAPEPEVLAGLWTSLWSDVRRSVSPSLWQRIRILAH